MGREWKPGDVVSATVNGRPNVRVIAGWSKFDPQLRWGELSTRWADGDDDECWFMPSQVTDQRPLVVIDPEDREQVERLNFLWQSQTHADVGGVPMSLGAYRMQEALRSLVTPPKPDEPQGLGAVVEDADDVTWIRHQGAIAPWHRADAGGNERAWRYWSDIDARQIKSQGWSE